MTIGTGITTIGKRSGAPGPLVMPYAERSAALPASDHSAVVPGATLGFSAPSDLNLKRPPGNVTSVVEVGCGQGDALEKARTAECRANVLQGRGHSPSRTFRGPKERLSQRVLAGIAVALALAAGAAAVTQPSALEVKAGERLVVVAPHPDDETLGAGGLIQRVLERRGAVRVVFVTAGDGYVEAVVHETGRPRPRPAEYVAYGERRLREARRALHELGGDTIRTEHLLGFPDGGLHPLLTAHYWRRAHPERSATTGVSQPPYLEAEHQDVRYDGDDLRTALVRCFRDVRPTIIAFPDPLDRHLDHHASGIFTLLAVTDLTAGPQRSRVAMPRLLAYLVHWPDWPADWDVKNPPLDTRPAPLDLPGTLPARGLSQTMLTLTDGEVAAKGAALAKYASQQEELGSLLAAFVRHTEPFTVFTTAELRRIGRMIERLPGDTMKR